MTMKYDSVLYDLDPRAFLHDEVKFYKELVNKFKLKTILELGVGTGRIFSKLLPAVSLAVGIDISESMIESCKKKCSNYHNYNLYTLSFVDFNLNDTFDLVYMPFNTFQHLLTENDQTECLMSIKTHMHRNSYFILDVMNGDNLSFDFKTWKLDYTSNLPEGRAITREQKTISIDSKTSIVHKVFKYSEVIDGRIKSVQEFDALMKITPNHRMQELLKTSGFEIENVWSDYLFGHEKTAKMIYCLRIL